MLRGVSIVARLCFATALGLFVLAVMRWSPLEARVPLDVRALPLAGPLLAAGILAALTGRERPRSRCLPIALALLAACVGLVLTLVGRPAGLVAEASGPAGRVGETAPGAIDVSGRDLRALALPRQSLLRWHGELRPPASGGYELWAEGRGRVTVVLDGHTVLQAEGETLTAKTPIALARGRMAMDVRLEQTGPGLRLRLGWTRPDGRRETIPARQLGPPLPAWRLGLRDVLAWIVAALAGLLAWSLRWEAPRALPKPTPVTGNELALSALGLLALLVVMSWPLARDLAHTGPLDRPDGRLNAWILAWGGETLWSDPGRVFQAPAFHPLPDALAFSENLLLPAALAAPLQWLSGPVLAQNLVFLAGLLLSGLGVQLLVRRVSGDRLAAFAAGAYFAAGPHRWTRLSHIHAQLTVFLPFALLALDRFWERRTLRRALLVGLLLALQGWTSVYLGAITALTLATATAVACFGGLKPRDLTRLAASFLLAGLLLWPVAHPYARMRAFQGEEFTLETVATYAASLPSYAAAGTAAWGWLSQRLLDPATVRDTLFPGVIVLALGLVGVAVAPRRYRAVALVASAVAVVFSLGPQTGVYRFLHEHVVLVRAVRALARFALVPTLALSVLAGLALSGRRRLAVCLALGLMLVESANLPLRLGRYQGPSAASRWLTDKPGAVLVLPLAVDDTLAMLDGLAHRQPLVNGDSGFIPRPFDRAMELFAYGVDAEGLRFLRAVDVRHVLARGAPGEALVRSWPAGLREVAALGPDRIAEVEAGPRAVAVEPGQPAATRWTAEGAIVTLPEPQTIGRVAFELSNAEWIAEPRVSVSLDGAHWDAVNATANLADATLSLYRDPRHGRGELRFSPRLVLSLKLDPRLPARAGAFEPAP